MKKIFYNSAIFVFVLLGLQACKPDVFLNTPVPNISDVAFFADDASALSALAGVYDPIGWYNFSQLTEWSIGDVCSDDAVKGGGGPGDYAEIYDMENFKANSQNPLIYLRWKELYIGVNRANRLIDGIKDNKNINDIVKTRVIGEAKFLRGFYNFSLVKTFGAIPIIDHVLSPSEYTMPQNTLVECWTAIENDFKDAAAVLPKKSQMPATEMGRATWGAAAAFLTKAYIFQAKWPEAEAEAKEIVISNEYDLLPNYADLFKIETDNSIESVFDIQKADLKMPGWLDENEGSNLEVIMRSRDDRNQGWGFDQPTQNLYDEFEKGDIRRDLTIISDGDTLWKGTPDEEIIHTKKDPIHNPDAVTGYNRRKGTLGSSQRGNGSDQVGLNIRIIRYADVLLWQAEAAVHNGGDWQTPLNKVRARVGLGNSPISDPLEAVYHERRVELAMEGHRYWDLVRTGRGNLINGYTDNKRYFLIPQIEMNLNANLKQNPY